MDRVMRQNWNAVVTDKDTVYVVGDFAYKGAGWKEYADKLNGKKIFLNETMTSLKIQCRIF